MNLIADFIFGPLVELPTGPVNEVSLGEAPGANFAFGGNSS